MLDEEPYSRITLDTAFALDVSTLRQYSGTYHVDDGDLAHPRVEGDRLRVIFSLGSDSQLQCATFQNSGVKGLGAKPRRMRGTTMRLSGQ